MMPGRLGNLEDISLQPAASPGWLAVVVSFLIGLIRQFQECIDFKIGRQKISVRRFVYMHTYLHYM